MPMKRVLVIGNPGAGKTTLAVKLGRILDLPVHHLDNLFWRPGWKKSDHETWLARINQLIAEDRWLIDGTYDNTLHIRLPRADTVVYLDFPTRLCLWRILARTVRHYNSVRPDMADGCRERFDYEFFKYIMGYRRKIRPNIISLIDRYYEGENLIVLQNPGQVSDFLKTFSGRATPDNDRMETSRDQ